MEEEVGGEEKRGEDAKATVQRARDKLEALAKGMTIDETGKAETLDGQLTS
jgi:hypothetical protein